MDVWVGGSKEHELPFKVLEFSIKRRTSAEVRIHRLWDVPIDIPTPRHRENRSRTSFSFRRFTIPEAMGNEGVGLYLDSDMIVMADIAELFRLPHPMKSTLLCPSRSEVMLIDCSLSWCVRRFIEEMDIGRLTYGELLGMTRPDIHGPTIRAIPREWNCTDFFNETTRLLHYTKMSTQPWLKAGHPFGYLWERELTDAIGAGAIRTDDLMTAIDNAFVRPSLATLIAEKPPYDDAKFVFPNDRRAA